MTPPREWLASLMRQALLILWRYVWAFPVTLLGLPFVPLTLLTGGRVRLEHGVLEVYGGAARFFLRHCLLIDAQAMCLGHVILGQDRDSLELARDHEHVHVRQCERWGVFIIPAYVLSSWWAWRCGKNFYYDNRFEREAYGWDPPPHP